MGYYRKETDEEWREHMEKVFSELRKPDRLPESLHHLHDLRHLGAFIDWKLKPILEELKKMSKIDDVVEALKAALAEGSDRIAELATAKQTIAKLEAELAAAVAAPAVLPPDAASSDQLQPALDLANALKDSLAPSKV